MTAAAPDEGRPSPWRWLLPTLVGVVVHGFAGLALVGGLLFVVPSFSFMMAEVGAELPLATRVVVGTSDLLVGAPWLILLVGPLLLAIDALALALLARWLSPLLSWLSAGATAILLAAIGVGGWIALYAPIFAISSAISG